jgi:hypothetical protein
MPTTGWDGDKNYALFDDKMRVHSGRASNHNGILDWRDMLVKLVTVFLRFLQRNSISTQREAPNVSATLPITNAFHPIT